MKAADDLLRAMLPRIEGERGEGYDVRVLAFGARVREVPAGGRIAAANDPATDLAAALDALDRELRGAPLIAAVLLSDGNASTGDDPRDAAARAGDRGVPIYAVPFGGREERRDVRLAEVSAPEIAFVGSEVPVDFTVAWHGLRPGEGALEAKLLEAEGREVDAVDLELGAAPSGSLRAGFRIRVEEPGKRAYAIELPVREGEASAANNRRRFAIEALESFQVLYVTGTPSPEFAFLRRFLERDHQIRVTALLKAPGEGGGFVNRSTRPADRKLDRFPDTAEGLRPFHAVIFGDIERAAFTSKELEALRDFVGKQGGGFLMQGGMHAFGMGGYEGSPVADLVPVRIAASEAPVDDLFRLRLTEAGRESPIFQTAAGPSQADAFWDALPAFAGLNGVGGAKPGATVLAIHPTKRGADGGASVVAATARYGKGRVMALTVDETWRWRFDEAYDAKNVPARVYRDFWGQVVRWLGVPPERPGLRLLLPKKELAAGEDLMLRAQLLDEGLEPREGYRLRAEISRDGEAPVSLEMTPEGGTGSGTGTGTGTDRGSGIFKAVLPAPPIGSYEVRVLAESAAAGETLEDRDVLSVEEPTVELERVARNDATLAEIARLSGGRVAEPAAAAADVPGLIAAIDYEGRRSFREVKEAELWDAWSVLVLLLLVLAVEWLARRRAGIL